MKHLANNRNTTGNDYETSSLKSLAHKVLERNMSRNKHETNPLNGVSSLYSSETKKTQEFSLPSIVDDYEERAAIAEYDGRQNTIQAHRIAYQDAFITTLNAIPPDGILKADTDTDWFSERTKTVQNLLMTQGIQKPE